jgi:peptide deformylase
MSIKYLFLTDKMEKKLINMYPLVIGAQERMLRTIATPVAVVSKEIRLLAADLIELMREYDGV